MKGNWFTILFCFVVFLLVLLSSYKLVLMTHSYNPEQEQWLDYFTGGEKVEGEYTDLEISHMEDVKRVMNLVSSVFYICLGLVLLAGWYYKKDTKELIDLCYYGGLFAVVGVGLLLLMILLSFNFVFMIFHELFFPQGNWQFAADSLLIQTFPLDFFIGLGRKIFLAALCSGAVLLGIGYYLRKKGG